MNCKKIQELILTDYLDQEMPQDRQKELETHIAACAACAEFLVRAKKAAIEPLANTKNAKLSQDIIWSKIQKEIQTEKESLLDYNQVPSFLEKLKSIIFFPKPRLAWSTLAVIAVLIIGLNIGQEQIDFGKNNQVKIAAVNSEKVVENQIIEIEREEYLSYLLDQDDAYTGYGTSLESYFL
ncbi:MAG: zf-HC2 domain-containing protein [Candidatus Omnitrophica bacterium]|nr:zf-HC2 domain-containing protein [Candidatus Omnitrophota bacterium]